MKMILAVVAAVVAVWWFGFRDAGPTLKIDGDRLEVSHGDQQLRYEISPAVSGRYMLFGANGSTGNAGEAWFAGIPLAKARELKSRYPDFHRCDSPGANEAKSSVISMTLVTADPKLPARFADAADDFDRRFKAKDNRLCLRLDGRPLTLVGASVQGIEAQSIPQLPADQRMLLVDRFEAVDCAQEF